MLSEDYEQGRRRVRRKMALATVVSSAAIAGLVRWGVFSPAAHEGAAICAAIAVVLLAYLVGFGFVPALFERPAPLWPLFDRSIRVPPGTLPSHPRGSEAGRLALTLHGRELDELAVQLGKRPLSSFLSGREDHPNYARHDPAAAVEVIDALLQNLQPSESLDVGAVQPGLQDLRARLQAAADAGAGFCLVRADGWSGAAMDAYKLYPGPYESDEPEPPKSPTSAGSRP